MLKDKNLGGFETLASIPATVGGAVVNSLSAFNVNFSDCILKVECFEKHNPKKHVVLSNLNCCFDYRTSIFKTEEYVITKVVLSVEKRNKFIIEKNMNTEIFVDVTARPIQKFLIGKKVGDVVYATTNKNKVIEIKILDVFKA